MVCGDSSSRAHRFPSAAGVHGLSQKAGLWQTAGLADGKMPIASKYSPLLVVLASALFCCQGWFPERAHDSGPVDATADAEMDGDADVAGDADGDDERTVEELLINIQAWLRQSCECRWEGWGYSRIEECLEAYLYDEIYTRCYIEAYGEHEATLGHSLSCLVSSWETMLSCSEEVDCDESELIRCSRDLDEALEACPEVTDLSRALFEESRQQCVMGEDSGCPDDDEYSDELGEEVFTGSNDQMGDDLLPGCVASQRLGADVALTWSAPVSAIYLFDTLGSEYDTILYLLRNCTGLELDCNDDFDDEGNTFSLIEIFLEEGQEIIVVVDAKGADERGRYVVNITLDDSEKRER